MTCKYPLYPGKYRHNDGNSVDNNDDDITSDIVPVATKLPLSLTARAEKAVPKLWTAPSTV